MMPDWWNPNHVFWLLPLVAISVPVLAGGVWLTSDYRRYSFRYDDRPSRHPRARVALNLGVGAVLVLGSGVLVWNPRIWAPLIWPILLLCLFYFSGRLRRLRIMTNQPNRVDGTILGVGGVVLLAAGLLLWASALYLAVCMPHIHAFHPDDEAQRLGGLFAAAFWSALFCGIGAHVHWTWRRILAQRRAS